MTSQPQNQNALASQVSRVSDAGRTMPTPSRRRLPGWRLWVPLMLQSALIMAVPAQDVMTVATGTAVTLQTAPVDPYDFMRGYYQTLSYDISRLETLRSLPGGEAMFADEGDWEPRSFYVVLAAPQTQATPPAPWQPVRVSKTRPQNLTPQQIALQGDYTGVGIGMGQVTYGLERYYMPAHRRQDVNADINQTQWQDQTAFVVDVKVDRRGNAVPVGLWVRDRNYRF